MIDLKGFNLESMVDTIIRWSDINTGSYNIPGLEGMLAILSQDFSILECEKSVIPLPPVEYINDLGHKEYKELAPMLRLWKRPKAPTQVLLMGHMDTVFGVDHPFQKAIRKTENILNGPGVTDMKGGLAVMLEALKILEKQPMRDQIGWEVLINPDEEISSVGSSAFMEERAKYHQFGLLFEPAMDDMGSLAGDRKGSGKFTLVVRGRAAHAGRDFNQGVNAIFAMSKFIQKVEELNGQREKVTINVGLAKGGSAINVVPDLAICQIDVRINDISDELWILEHFQKKMAEINQNSGIKAELYGKFTRKPKLIAGSTVKLYEIIQKIAKDIGLNLHVRSSGGCTDGNNLASVGLPNVDSLGVIGGNMHSSEEYLLIDRLEERVRLATAILLYFCEFGFEP